MSRARGRIGNRKHERGRHPAASRGRAAAAARGVALAALWLAGTACGSDPEPPAGAALAPLAVTEHDRSAGGAPVIRSVRIDPMQPVPGASVRAVVAAHDPDGDPLEMRYRWRVDGMERDGAGPDLALGGVPIGATVEVEVVVSDGTFESPMETAAVRVVNRAPLVEGLGIEPPDRVYPGDKVVVTPVASDPDGDLLDFRFEWLVNGERVDGADRSFATTGLQQGDRVRVRVFASDGRDESRALESADILVGSAHPEIVSTPPGMSADGVFRYRIEAQDPDGDRTLRFRLDEGPDGMKLDQVLGEIEWRPGAKQTGVHPVKVAVIDSSKLETTQAFQLTVSRSEEPAPPAAPAEEPAAAQADDLGAPDEFGGSEDVEDEDPFAGSDF